MRKVNFPMNIEWTIIEEKGVMKKLWENKVFLTNHYIKRNCDKWNWKKCGIIYTIKSKQ